MRYWYRSMPVVGIALAILIAMTVVVLATDHGAHVPSMQFLINGFFIFPGLLLSFVVTQTLLRKRVPPRLSIVERGLLVAIYLTLAAVIALSFAHEQVLASFVLWSALVALAVGASVVIGFGNRVGAPTDSKQEDQ